MYNPLTFKTPYGATAVGKATKIRFPLDTTLGVERVFLILRKVRGEEDITGKPASGGQFLADGGEIDEYGNFRIEMPLASSENGEDVFEVEFVPLQWGIFNYRFEGALEGGGTAFFGRAYNGDAMRGDWLPEWQLTVSKHDYKTPNWAKHGVTYHIFADRFCRDKEHEFSKKGRLHTYWNERPDIAEDGKDYRADDFFGGNISGIISKLDYIKELGVNLIYLSPIFESASNHRYDTGDYLKIDELFGDEEQFKTLIGEAKKRGISIMLDGVFNHTGADSLYFNKYGNYPTVGAYQSQSSPYFDWYFFKTFPNSYECWWGSTVVPTVNKSAEGVRQLFLGEGGVIDKWTKLGVKGWRLDVVDELPVDFTSELCERIKKEGEDVLVIGEVWEDATTKVSYEKWRPYFMGGQLDGVMNYPFKEAILDFCMTGDAKKFVADVSPILENYPKQSLDVAMNLLDSHDTVRALTALSGVEAPHTKRERADLCLSEEQYRLAAKRLKLASAIQYTLPGTPCLYYGDEAGAQGFEDPLNRGTYPWGREDEDLIAHYKALGKMREKYADILVGETRFVEDDELLVFKRSGKAGVLTVYANASDKPEVCRANGVDAISGKRIKNRITIAPCSARMIVSGV